MSYKALYRQWRPTQFEDIVEQKHIVKTLKHAVTSGRVSHAYLFCGTKGTGKTTTAKILARAVNCLEPLDGNPCNKCSVCVDILKGSNMDIMEIDAASNNSVDNVREIRDEVIYTPSQSKYKVYIIDEVHMLSSGAFNALLKTLEEPPGHVIFILATTEPHKLPATILSRCQRYDFKRISSPGIVKQLQKIASDAQVQLEASAGNLIANLSDGALRDAISLLDQCIGLGAKSITYDDVLSIVGIVNEELLEKFVDAIINKDVSKIFSLIEDLSINGKDYRQFTSDLVRHFRNMMISSMSDVGLEVEVSPSTLEKMKTQLKSISKSDVIRYIKELSLLESNLKWSSQPRILLEITTLRLIEGNFSDSIDSLEHRIECLEKKIAEGNFTITDTKRSNASNSASAKPPSKSGDGKKASSESVVKKVESLSSPIWNDILEEIKASGKRTLHAFLIGTKAIETETYVAIVFEPSCSFNKINVSKPENLEIVKDHIEKKLGREVRIKCIDIEDSEAVTAIENDLVVKGKEIAEKFNIPVEIIDE